MKSSVASLIEAWFADYRQDGNFVFEGIAAPYTVVGPSRTAGRIVFATKPDPVASAIYAPGDCAGIGLIGHYGLPCADDLRWIRKAIVGHDLFFLGDLDPPDLMIYCWLRARLRPMRVVHLGINDAYLDKLQVHLPRSYVMKCSRSERQSLPVLLKVFPDLIKIVGTKCAKVVGDGRKIELDAVVSSLRSAATILRPILQH